MTGILKESAYLAANDYTLNLTTEVCQYDTMATVHFDLTGSTFAKEDDIILAEFMWDFGDTGDIYNKGEGFYVSHVYKSPGVYTATCKVYFEGIGDHVNSYGRYKQVTYDVTVADNSDNYTNYYISADGLDTNDGSESSPFLTFNHAMEFISDNVKFNFRNGDTFELDEYFFNSAYNNVVFSNYGDPSSPSSDNPKWFSTVTSSSGGAFIVVSSLANYLFSHIDFTSGGHYTEPGSSVEGHTYPSGISLSSPKGTVLNCNFYELGVIAVNPASDYLVAQSCRITATGRTGFYAASSTAEQLSVIGCYAGEFVSDHEEHVMRIQTYQKVYLADNDFRANDNKTCMQVRGNTSFVTLWHNQFDRIVGFNPQNSASAEYIQYCVANSNLVMARDYSSGPDYAWDQYGIYMQGTHLAIRNNIILGFKASLSTNTHPIVGECSYIYIYNNTVSTDTSNNRAFLYSYPVGGSKLYLANNVFYNSFDIDSSYGDGFIFNTGTTIQDYYSDFNVFYGAGWVHNIKPFRVETNYSLSEWQIASRSDLHSLQSDPLLNTTIDFDNPDASLLAGFGKPGLGSPAIGVGGNPKLFTRFDFNGNYRDKIVAGAICEVGD